MFLLTAGKNDAGQRLDRFIVKALPAMPLPMVYRLIRQKKIKLNRKRAEPGAFLCEGDTVQVFAPPHFAEKDDGRAFTALKQDPDIIFEDCNILVINKPSGLLVHESDNPTGGELTLAAMLKSYLYRKGEYNPDAELTFAPALANRIDRNTAGIVLAAKNAAALRALESAFRERTVIKKYICIVCGVPAKESGILNGYLLRNEKTKTVTVYQKDPPRGALPVKTGYRVIASGKSYALVEARLYTGRTHQIRAQFSYAGFPLLGDGKYGVQKEAKALGYASQALCSRSVCFQDMQSPLEYLNGREFSVPDGSIDFVSDYYKRLSLL